MGGFYEEHLDVPQRNGGWYGKRRQSGLFSGAAVRREVSFVLYLNEGWEARWGGALRIHPSAEEGAEREHPEREHVDVVPAGGTLVLMRSDRVRHAVMETHRRRECVVGWFRTEDRP